MIKQFKLVSLFCFIAFASCTNEDGVILNNLETLDNQLEPTIELVKRFASEHQSDPVTKADGSDIKVLNYEVKTYTFNFADELKDTPQTKAGEISNQVDVYTINFEKSGKQGYTIATSDPRIEKVYAYVESGSLSDTTYNLGLSAFLSYIPATCKKDLVNYYTGDIETKSTGTKRMIIQPLTNLIWNQTYPYNKYADVCSNMVGTNYNGHAPAGCTSIAVAQAMAFLKPTALRNKYNLDYVINDYQIYPPHSTAENVSLLVKDINQRLGTKFGCEGSGANLRDIRNSLTEWGIKYEYRHDANVIENSLANCLACRYPHMTRGERKSPRSGHAWLWTGIDFDYDAATAIPTMKVTKVYQVYCNWGWGGSSNGWFASYEQPDPNMQPYLDNNDQIYVLAITR